MHENCVVLKFSYAGYSVMLTGDSNKPCWERVVGYYEGREDDLGCINPEFHELPLGEPSFRIFAQVQPSA